MDSIKKVVFEIGTRTSRIGFSGERNPRMTFPTVVGTFKQKSASSYFEDFHQYYVGKEALEIREKLELIYPIEFGHIRDWKAIKWILQYSFNKLEVKSNNCIVLLIEPFHSDLLEDEKLANLLFEDFKIAGIYISYREVLILYGSLGDSFIVDKNSETIRNAILAEEATGIVIHIDFNKIYIVPVYRGFSIGHSIKILEFGCRDIIIYLIDLLEEKGFQIDYPNNLEQFYETICHLIEITPYSKKFGSQNWENQDTKNLVEFLNEKSVNLRNELLNASEILFNPMIIGILEIAVDWAVGFSINNIDGDIRETIFNNILFTGECSMIQGVKEKLGSSLEDKFEQLIKNPELNETQILKYMTTASELIKNDVLETKELKLYDVKINPTKDFNLAWVGGSYLSSLKAFEKIWISKDEFSEKGVKIMRKVTTGR